MIRTVLKVAATGLVVAGVTFGIFGIRLSSQAPMVRSALHDFHIMPTLQQDAAQQMNAILTR